MHAVTRSLGDPMCPGSGARASLALQGLGHVHTMTMKLGRPPPPATHFLSIY
eukprot:COSAG01_NODE_50978_length_358_cov_2.424710_1_plen_51_part_01